MTITADQRTALEKVGRSLVDLAEAFAKPASKNGAKPAAAKMKTKPAAGAKSAKAKSTRAKYGPIDASTPAAVREKRQGLILAAIDAAGGSVSRQEWLEIAGRYGYDSRRLGGFFAKNGGVGMLAMSPDRELVQLTEHGKSRL